jgi:hypothetical protein
VHLNGKSFSIPGHYFGDIAHFHKTISPELLRGFPNANPSSGAAEVDWIEALTELNGAESIAQPLNREDYKLHDSFFAKSLTIPEKTPFTAKALGLRCE